MLSSLSPVVKRLLVLNGLAFVLAPLMQIDSARYLGLYSIYSDSFYPYQFFTYMFIHGGLWHLFGNMFALLIFGSYLERFLGQRRFLFLYLFTGIGAGLLYSGINYVEMRGMRADATAYAQAPNPEEFNRFVLNYAPNSHVRILAFIEGFAAYPTNKELQNESIHYVDSIVNEQVDIPMVGASGAVFGVLMAFGLLFPNVVLFLLFPPIPVKAKYLVLFYLVYEIWAEVQRMPGDNVAHLAHIGGMFLSFVLIKYWQRTT